MGTSFIPNELETESSPGLQFWTIAKRAANTRTNEALHFMIGSSQDPCVSIRVRLAIRPSAIRELLSPTDRSTRIRARQFAWISITIASRTVYAIAIDGYNPLSPSRLGSTGGHTRG